MPTSNMHSCGLQICRFDGMNLALLMVALDKVFTWVAGIEATWNVVVVARGSEILLRMATKKLVLAHWHGYGPNLNIRWYEMCH